MAISNSSSNASDYNLTIFNFDEQFPLGSLLDNEGNPWFIAANICKPLELSNVGQAVSRLDDDEKSDIILNDAAGRPNRFVIVNESGLYSLVLASRKPIAKRFKKWITSVVLPSLRKTGQYSIEPLSTERALLVAVQQLVEHSERLDQYGKRIEHLESQTGQIVAENNDLSDQVDYWKDQADINYGIKRRPWRT